MKQERSRGGRREAKISTLDFEVHQDNIAGVHHGDDGDPSVSNEASMMVHLMIFGRNLEKAVIWEVGTAFE